MFTELDAKTAILKLAKIKGLERAQLIERMFRLETRHFKSTQYQLSGTPGMEDGKWSNLDESKFTKFQMKDNHLVGAKQMRTFLKWNDVYDFTIYLSDYIDRHQGNYARWNSTDPVKQQKYRNSVKGIINRFV